MIDTPGIYDISNEHYQSDPCVKPSLSSGIAKTLLAKSALHARLSHPRLNSAYMPIEGDRLDFGSAAHDLLFQGGHNIVVVDCDDWRTKAARELRDAARAENKIPILHDKYLTIKAMTDAAKTAIESSPDLQVKLDSGKAEQSFFWQDGGDVWCRSRPDWYHPDLGLILDYKTTAGSASPAQMARTAISMGWDVQAGHYLRGYRNLLPLARPPRFVFVVQENTPPYAVSFVGIEGAMKALGEDKADKAIRVWRHCLTTGEWRGYTERVIYPEPPAFAMIEWESEVER